MSSTGYSFFHIFFNLKNCVLDQQRNIQMAKRDGKKNMGVITSICLR